LEKIFLFSLLGFYFLGFLVWSLGNSHFRFSPFFCLISFPHFSFSHSVYFPFSGFFFYPTYSFKTSWIGQVYFIVDTKKNLGKFRQGSPVSQLFIYQIIPNNRQATDSRNPATEQAKPGRNS
jgi:hypothetical protein